MDVTPHALDGTIGTRPQLQQDPSHPFRHMCDPWDDCLDPTTGPKGTEIADGINYLVELAATTGKLAADQTFIRNAAPNAIVEAIAVSPDGQRLDIGGRFTQAGGESAPRSPPSTCAPDSCRGLQAVGVEERVCPRHRPLR